MTSIDHLSIYVRQWHPSTLTLGVQKEVVLKESLVEHLKEEVRLTTCKLHFQEEIYQYIVYSMRSYKVLVTSKTMGPIIVTG